jgi:hypothetical protein
MRSGQSPMFGTDGEGLGKAELAGGKLSGWKFLPARGGSKGVMAASLR